MKATTSHVNLMFAGANSISNLQKSCEFFSFLLSFCLSFFLSSFLGDDDDDDANYLSYVFITSLERVIVVGGSDENLQESLIHL